jgi:hypothetical protein
MGWDKKSRGSKKGYYYRWVRSNGRLVKRYVGHGPIAEMAAHLDEERCEQRRAARLSELAVRAELARADLALAQSRKATLLLLSAELLLAGYHNHHGIWRKRRGRATQLDEGDTKLLT